MSSSMVQDFRLIVNGVVQEFVAASARLNVPVMSDLAEMVRRAFQCESEFINEGIRMQQPANDEDLRRLAGRTLNVLQEIQEFREGNRIEDYSNHLAAVAESILALSWITVRNTPLQFIRDMREAGDYYGNRVLTGHRGDEEHIAWIKKWNAVLRSLEEYVREHHRTGFSWNAMPGFSANPPPPPPPPPEIGDHARDQALHPLYDPEIHADRQQMLIQINQGPRITQMLRPVNRHVAERDAPVPQRGAAHIHDAPVPQRGAAPIHGAPLPQHGLFTIHGPAPFHGPGMMRGAGDAPLPIGGGGDGPHIAFAAPAAPRAVAPAQRAAAPAQRAAAPAQRAAAPAQRAAAPAQGAAAPAQGAAAAAPAPAAPVPPPLFVLEGRRWRIEFQRNNPDLVLAPQNMSETVAMFQCERSTFKTLAKMNAVTIDNCKRCVIVLQDIISSVELIRCQNVEIRCIGSCPNITIDNCDSIQVFLSDSSADCEVITSKSTSTNICRLDADDDYVEFPVPEQIRSVLIDGNLQSSVIEHRM